MEVVSGPRRRSSAKAQNWNFVLAKSVGEVKTAVLFLVEEVLVVWVLERVSETE